MNKFYTYLILLGTLIVPYFNNIAMDNSSSSNSHTVVNVDKDSMCVICQEYFVSSPSKKVVQIKCDSQRHTLHEECALNWFTKSPTTGYDTSDPNNHKPNRKCPVCDHRYLKNELPNMQVVALNDNRSVDYNCVGCNKDIRSDNLPVYQVPCASAQQHFVHKKCTSSCNAQCPSCKQDLDANDISAAFTNQNAVKNMRLLAAARTRSNGLQAKGKNKDNGKPRTPVMRNKQKQQPEVVIQTPCPVCKLTLQELRQANMNDVFIKFDSCDHALCVACMTKTLEKDKKCPSCPRQINFSDTLLGLYNTGHYQTAYRDKILSDDEIKNIREKIANVLSEPKLFDWCTGYCVQFVEKDRQRSVKTPCNHTLCMACLLHDKPSSCPVLGCKNDNIILNDQTYADMQKKYNFTKKPQLDIACAGHCRTHNFMDRKKFVDQTTGGFAVRQQNCGHYICGPCGIYSPQLRGQCGVSSQRQLTCGHTVQYTCNGTTPQCPHIVSHTLACGHQVNICPNMIGRTPCPQESLQTLPCGHQATTCSNNLAQVPCPHAGIRRVLSCGRHYKTFCLRPQQAQLNCTDEGCLLHAFRKKLALGAVGIASLGYLSYKTLQHSMYGQFNSLEYSADEIIKTLISEEPYWDFDLYNRPVTTFELCDQYDIASIVNSVSSDALKQKLEAAIHNFDGALHAVWSALENGYYNKGKVVFMREQQSLVQKLQHHTQELKDVLAECRAQVSVWKKALGITAMGVLGVGAWLYGTYNIGG